MKDGVTIRTPVEVPFVGETYHEEKRSYDKIPATGITMTVASVDRQINGAGTLTALIFKVSSFSMRKEPLIPKGEKTWIEAKLTESSFKYHLIYIGKNRNFFPGFKVPFMLETDIGDLTTHVTSADAETDIGNPEAGYYIQKGLPDWFRQHRELKPGDIVRIEVIEPKQRYRLSA